LRESKETNETLNTAVSLALLIAVGLIAIFAVIYAT
jgi:hypothetical protein